MGTPANVVIPQTGSAIYVAPVGTAAPTSESSSLNAAFVDVGHISDDVPSLAPETETSEIVDWLGEVVASTSTTTWSITVPFLETNPESLKLAFGGGTFTGTAGGGVKFVPGETTQERAIVLHIVNGSQIFRLYLARCAVNDVSEVSPSREDGTVWEISFTVLAPTSGDKFAIFTNIASVVAASA